MSDNLILHEDEDVIVFMDNYTLARLLKDERNHIDYNNIHAFFRNNSRKCIIYAYGAISEEVSFKLEKLYTYLSCNGFRMRVTNHSTIGHAYSELSVIMSLDIALSADKADKIIVIANDDKLMHALTVVQQLNKASVTLITNEAKLNGPSRQLRACCDAIVSMDTLVQDAEQQGTPFVKYIEDTKE